MNANGSSSFGTGYSWSSSKSFGGDGSASAGAGGSGYQGGVDDRRFEYGARRCVRYRYGGQSYSGGSGRGGGDSNHFKVATRGWTGRVGGGDAGGGKGGSTIHRQEANKGGLE
ncbi:rRNA 2'-O-methyltransferase fibrillarin-like [Neltuma alba]|uniref:rRNA 2'-O-methyltransferase fibrillarin-like n=1 Tax=Neltuma alba TaxID=207710 RepID=UPI0010A56821|nr:rRNA 2'-O-methyltransferase fibrillarin-like [Prosopis alba]